MKIYKYGMKRPFGIGTFPKNDAVIGTEPKNKTKFKDILLVSKPLSAKEVKDFELTPLDKDSIISYIAENSCNVETLETQSSDELDFHDIAVWNIKEALEMAFKAGQEYNNSEEEELCLSFDISMLTPGGRVLNIKQPENGNVYKLKIFKEED